MKHRYLVIAMAAAIASMTVHADDARSPGAVPALPLYVQQQDLATVLAAPHALRPSAPETRSAPLVWVQRGDLDTIGMRNAVATELARGRAILVTGPPGDEQGEAETFGFRASGATSIYWRTPDGFLDVTTVDAELPLAEATKALGDWLDDRLVTAAPSAAAMSARAAAEPAGGDSYAPRIEIHEDKTFAGGRAVRHNIVVLRDIQGSRDEKVVIVTTEVDQAPGSNGAFWDGSFLAEGKGYHMYVPDRYVVTTQIAGVGQSVPLTIQNFEPETDGAVDRSINETVSVKTSSGTSASFDILEGLAKNDAPHLGKIALGFTSATERTEQAAITMVLKDYFVQASTREENGIRAVDWVFPLAPDIAAKANYFEDGQNIHGALNSTSRMTSMMRHATLQTTSVWRVPGNYEGKLDISTRATVDNRIYDSLKHSTSTEADAQADIAFTSRIDLGSPHLTRQPTIRLQSLYQSGACLTQRDPGTANISLEVCEKGDGGITQQWYLEVDNTYRNRGSGQCLTADRGNGAIHAAECSGTPLNQQWKWSADRIHSLYEGGPWRLHIHDGALNAMFDPQRHQAMVSNQYHALLRPWSSYPNKPSKGDVIPNLSGASPQIPESYLEYKAVGVEERWQPLPVHVGL